MSEIRKLKRNIRERETGRRGTEVKRKPTANKKPKKDAGNV